MLSPRRRLSYAWLTLLIAVAFLLGYQVAVAPVLENSEQEPLVDIWFIGHFVYGVILAGCWQRITKEPEPAPWRGTWWFYFAVVSMFVWEGAELQMELGHWGIGPQKWMDGIETISNRYLIDPVVGFIGMMACRRWPKMWLPTFAFGIFFEIVQVSAPTSMSIQHWLLASVGTFISSAF
jgi:hypothetical protein